MANVLHWCQQQILHFIASVIFYTAIPLPYWPNLDFQRVAFFAPIVGLMIGSILGGLDGGLNYVGVPALTRNALVVGGWIAITGGLHLDGAMDTADGLAVGDPKRRLQVMTDSATGAFGAMAAIMIIILKITALTEITENHYLVLISACGWGRWGQQMAIACYPYLKPTGKGAFHKQAIRSYLDLFPSWFLLLGLSIVIWLIYPQKLILSVVMVLTGSVISVISAAWFNHQLGGHTGDTYGAVVEWTEALFLCVLSSIYWRY
ncbi:MAG: adenosylcobinamide-GDP ribazoletransferase [Cuspidothrix sp.]